MPFVIVALVVAWLVKRSRLAWSWNPITWFESAVGSAGSILSDVKNWVLGIVQDAVNLVENDVFSVFQWAWGAIQDVEIGAYLFAQWTESAIGNVTRWASYAIGAVEGLASRWVSDLGAWASRAIADLQHWASTAINDLGAWASRAIADLQHWASTAINDLGSWAARALADLQHWASTAISDLGKWTVDALKQLWGDLYNTIYRDFIKPIEDVLHWVKLAWDWVVWFATHPFSVLHSVETDVIDWEHHAIEDVENIVRGDSFRKGLDAMGSFLGG